MIEADLENASVSPGPVDRSDALARDGEPSGQALAKIADLLSEGRSVPAGRRRAARRRLAAKPCECAEQLPEPVIAAGELEVVQAELFTLIPTLGEDGVLAHGDTQVLPLRAFAHSEAGDGFRRPKQQEREVVPG